MGGSADWLCELPLYLLSPCLPVSLRTPAGKYKQKNITLSEVCRVSLIKTGRGSILSAFAMTMVDYSWTQFSIRQS